MWQIQEELQNYNCKFNHNRKIEFISLDPNSLSDERLLCSECMNIGIYSQIMKIERVIEQIQINVEKKTKISNDITRGHYSYMKFIQSQILMLKDKQITIFDKILSTIDQWKQEYESHLINKQPFNLHQEIQLLINKQSDNFECMERNKLKNINQKWIKETYPYFKQLFMKEEYQVIYEALRELGGIFQQPEYTQYLQLFPPRSQNTSILAQSFFYKLIPKMSISEPQICSSIAISKDNQLLASASKFDIKVFYINQKPKKMDKVVDCLQHIDTKQACEVHTLNFFNAERAKHSFVSGFKNGLIIVWKLEKFRFVWYQEQQIKGHREAILCLQLSQNDQIISGSQDYTIRFWQKDKQYACSQILSGYSGCPYGISLNQDESKLAALLHNKFIIIIEKNNNDWFISQSIPLEHTGYRLCFISNSMFIFQPLQINKIFIFSQSQESNEFKKIQEVQINGRDATCIAYFPAIYLSESGIIVIKNGYSVNILQFKNQLSSQDYGLDIKLVQSIDYDLRGAQAFIFGTISQDGKFLVIWDSLSRQISFRVYHQN